MQPAPPAADTVLEHAGAIRALALSILRDEHAADDVVQETWLRAFTHPPPHQGAIGGWLRRVAHGLAISRLRTEGRRKERETRRGRDREPEPAPYDALERGEVLRAVVDEALALEEPYRETILRRYFEGLPAPDVARAMRTTTATVESRLQRARSQLRERLERRFATRRGGMRAILLAVIGLPTPIAKLAPTWTAPHAIAASGAAVCLVLVGVYVAVGPATKPREKAPPVPLAGLEDVQSPPRRTPTRIAASDTPIEHDRRALAAPVEAIVTVAPVDRAPVPVAAGAYPFALTIEALDAAGLPAPGLHVELGPEPGPLADAGTTGDDGRLALTWNGDSARATLLVRLGRELEGGVVRRIVVDASPVALVATLVTSASDSPRDRKRAMLLAGSSASVEGLGELRFDAARNLAVVDPDLLVTPGAPREPTATSSAEATRVLDSVLADRLAALRGVTSSDETATALDRVAGDRFETLRYVKERPTPDRTTSSRTRDVDVRDEQGTPIAHALVAWHTTGGSSYRRARTDADGRARVTASALERTEVFVTAPTGGLPVVHGRIDPRDDRVLELTLPRVERDWLVLRGLERDEAGSGTIELRGVNGELVDVCAIDASEPVRLARSSGDASYLVRFSGTPAARAQRKRSGEGLVLDVPELSRDSVDVLVRGEDVADASMRLVSIDTGEGIDGWRLETESDGSAQRAFRFPRLFEGDYDVAVRARARPWAYAGRIQVRASLSDRAFEVQVDPPADLKLEGGNEARLTLATERSGMRVVSPTLLVGAATRILAAAGPCDLSIERPKEPAVTRQFGLFAGGLTRIAR